MIKLCAHISSSSCSLALELLFVTGVRIFCMGAKGIVQTILLAVKHFRPASSLEKVTGQRVILWVRQVLAQNGLH